jgi:hypothetical protein
LIHKLPPEQCKRHCRILADKTLFSWKFFGASPPPLSQFQCDICKKMFHPT